MATRVRTWVTSGLVAVGAIGLVAAGGVTAVLAETATLDGVSATGRVDSTPLSFWFGQVNRDGICRMVSGCVGATGADPNWVFQVNVDVPGVGIQAIPVNVTAGPQVVGESASYRLSYDSSIGSLNGTVNLALKPAGDATNVTLTLQDFQATGLAAQSIPQFQAIFQPYVQAQLGVLSRERVDAGTKVTLVVKPGSKAKASVVVTATSMTKAKPKATGQMRVLIGKKVVCTAKVRNSRGSCSFAPPKKGTQVRAVVTGKLSNGYPVWNSASKKYGR